MTRAEYDRALDRMRRGGMVTERDWPATGDAPAYRYGQLSVTAPERVAIEMARDLAALACEVAGYLVLVIHEGRGMWSLSVTRDLTPEEIELLHGPGPVEVSP